MDATYPYETRTAMFNDLSDMKSKCGMARGSHSKVRGGKRKSLFNNQSTRKEMEAMNGQVETYHLRGLTYAEFKSYPHDMQKEILKTLVREYGASRAAIARALETNENVFNRYVKSHDLCDVFAKKTYMPIEDERRMTEMIRGTVREEIAEPAAPAEPVELVSPAPSMVIADNALDIDLHGSIDPKVVLASIQMLMSNRVPTAIHLSVRY